MTARIRDFLRSRQEDVAAGLPTSTSSARTTSTLPRRCPTRAWPVRRSANPAPEVGYRCSRGWAPASTPPRSPRSRWRSRQAPRRIASPSATPSKRRRRRGAPTRSACASMRSTARPRSRRSPAQHLAAGRVRQILDCVGGGVLLSKFGCEPAMAVDVLEHAHRLGRGLRASRSMSPAQRNPHAWGRSPPRRPPFRDCGERGLSLSMVNLGGGFPTRFAKNVPTVKTYGTLRRSSARCGGAFRQPHPETTTSRAAAWSAMPA